MVFSTNATQAFKRVFKSVWEEFIAIMLTTVGNFITGTIFGLGSKIVALKPSVLMLAPAAMAMRGNVYSSLGSRLGSLLHLGSIEPKISRNPVLIDNIGGVFAQAISLSIYLGIVSSIFYFAFSGVIDAYDLITISVLTGLFALPLMLIVTFSVTFITYLKGLDPDNFSAPLITLAGDMISLPILFTATYVALWLSLQFKIIFLIIMILLITAFILWVSKSNRTYLKKLLYESVPILFVCGILEMIAGSALVINVESVLKLTGILTVIPGFLEDGGAIGGILASKISTKLHIGDIEPSFIPSRKVLVEFGKIYFVAGIAFPIIGAYGYFISYGLGLKIPSLPVLAFITFLSGIILTVIVSILVYFISIISFKRGIDPDNVTIPLITSMIDAVGMLILVSMFLSLYKL